MSRYQAEMSAFREEVRGEMAGMRVDLAQLEVRLVRWLLVAAVIGGLVGGLMAAVSKLFP